MGCEEEKVKKLMRYVLRRLDDEEEIEEERNERIYAKDILFDLELFAQEIYEANIKREEEFLNLEFENGQRFSISVQERFDF